MSCRWPRSKTCRRMSRLNMAARGLAAVCAGLATVSPATNHNEFAIYLGGTYTHTRGWVPDFNYAAAVAGLIALTATGVQMWFTTHWQAAVGCVATLMWLFASIEMARQLEPNSTPGAALWLGWGAVVVTNWSIVHKNTP